jgi:hypothetical protein
VSTFQLLILLAAIPLSVVGVVFLLAIPLQLRRCQEQLQVLKEELRQARAWSAAELAQLRKVLAETGQSQGRLSDLEQRLEELALQGVDARPYQQAIRMVERGAGVEELISDCELSPAEARLIISLHGKA